jgi:hypothetical protein
VTLKSTSEKKAGLRGVSGDVEPGLNARFSNGREIDPSSQILQAEIDIRVVMDPMAMERNEGAFGPIW